MKAPCAPAGCWGHPCSSLWLWATLQWWCSSSSTAISTSLTGSCTLVGLLHTGKALPRRETWWHYCRRGNVVEIHSNIWGKGPVPPMGSEWFLLKEEKGEGGPTRLNLPLLQSSWLPPLADSWKGRQKRIFLKQKWAKNKVVGWLFEAACLTFFLTWQALTLTWLDIPQMNFLLKVRYFWASTEELAR